GTTGTAAGAAGGGTATARWGAGPLLGGGLDRRRDRALARPLAGEGVLDAPAPLRRLPGRGGRARLARHGRLTGPRRGARTRLPGDAAGGRLRADGRLAGPRRGAGTRLAGHALLRGAGLRWL